MKILRSSIRGGPGCHDVLWYASAYIPDAAGRKVGTHLIFFLSFIDDSYRIVHALVILVIIPDGLLPCYASSTFKTTGRGSADREHDARDPSLAFLSLS